MEQHLYLIQTWLHACLIVILSQRCLVDENMPAVGIWQAGVVPERYQHAKGRQVWHQPSDGLLAAASDLPGLLQ